jgi:putative membrane protein
MNFLLKLLLSSVAVLLAAYLLPGVTVTDFWVALMVAALMAILNATLKPILVVLTIPITFVTLGLFLLVINAIIILAVDVMIDEFNVDGFWWALAFSLVLSFIVSVFDSLTGSGNRRR